MSHEVGVIDYLEGREHDIRFFSFGEIVPIDIIELVSDSQELCTFGCDVYIATNDNKHTFIPVGVGSGGIIVIDNLVNDIDISTSANIPKDLMVIRPPDTLLCKRKMGIKDFLLNILNIPLEVIKHINKIFSKCPVRIK